MPETKAPHRQGSREAALELLESSNQIAEDAGINPKEWVASPVKYMEGAHWELGFVRNDIRMELGGFHGKAILYRNGRLEKDSLQDVVFNRLTGDWERYPD